MLSPQVRKWNPVLVNDWIPEMASDPKTEPNIVLADFVENANVAESVVGLNFRKVDTPPARRTGKVWTGGSSGGFD